MLHNYMFALMGGSVTDVACCVCVSLCSLPRLMPFPALSDGNPSNHLMAIYAGGRQAHIPSFLYQQAQLLVVCVLELVTLCRCWCDLLILWIG